MSQKLLTGTGSSTSTAMSEAAAATLPSATFMLADASAPTLADSAVMPAPSTPFSRELLFIPATPEHSDIRQTPQNLAFEKAVSHGGQATIFKAHTPSGTPVAVKVFENGEECLLEWRSLKKFSNFRVLPNALAHGTVRMPHPAGVQEKSCIVEEWLDGDTLAKHLRRMGRGMTVEETLSTISPVIVFLATAETELREHVIHQDIKTSNILLDSTGCVRLIDFGIAQTSRDQARPAWGTQGFSSPESCFPSSDEADLRKDSDAYSLAATMLALLAGENKPPAYGVVAQNSDGSLRYDPAWTDERERLAHERSIAPFPGFIEYGREKGIYLEEAALNDFVHDAETLDFLKEDIAETLQSTYGIEESAAAVEKAAHAAVDAFDAKLRATLGACLAVNAAQRPTTTQLKNALPRDKASYRHELHLLGLNAALGGGRILAQDAPSFEAGTFAQALDEFNSGHYAQAVGVFERLARQGCVSALYYLAICARDNLGGTSIKYSEADVMLFMGEAAAKGAVVAQFFLGCALYSGSYIAQGAVHHVEENRELGLSYIRKSAAHDEAHQK
ncbi:protein kinase domain-containing protein [Slackia isoflavoniconvertens]|uniref:protein kinase domain-containing protein n=1 Tax=Slackia isoflavoniconvertens TaxID=572010 RepID=UPI003AB95526